VNPSVLAAIVEILLLVFALVEALVDFLGQRGVDLDEEYQIDHDESVMAMRNNSIYIWIALTFLIVVNRIFVWPAKEFWKKSKKSIAEMMEDSIEAAQVSSHEGRETAKLAAAWAMATQHIGEYDCDNCVSKLAENPKLVEQVSVFVMVVINGIVVFLLVLASFHIASFGSFWYSCIMLFLPLGVFVVWNDVVKKSVKGADKPAQVLKKELDTKFHRRVHGMMRTMFSRGLESACPHCGSPLKDAPYSCQSCEKPMYDNVSKRGVRVARTVAVNNQHAAVQSTLMHLKNQIREYINVAILRRLQIEESLDEENALRALFDLLRNERKLAKLVEKAVEYVLHQSRRMRKAKGMGDEEEEVICEDARAFVEAAIQQVKESDHAESFEMHGSFRSLRKATTFEEKMADRPTLVFSRFVAMILLFPIWLAGGYIVITVFLFFILVPRALRVDMDNALISETSTEISVATDEPDEYQGEISFEEVLEDEDLLGRLQKRPFDLNREVHNTLQDHVTKAKRDRLLVNAAKMSRIRGRYPFCRFSLRNVARLHFLFDFMEIVIISFILYFNIISSWVQTEPIGRNWLRTNLSGLFLTIAALLDPIIAYRTSSYAYAIICADDALGSYLSNIVKANFFDSPQDILMRLSELATTEDEVEILSLIANENLHNAYEFNIQVALEFTAAQLGAYGGALTCGFVLDMNRGQSFELWNLLAIAIGPLLALTATVGFFVILVPLISTFRFPPDEVIGNLFRSISSGLNIGDPRVLKRSHLNGLWKAVVLSGALRDDSAISDSLSAWAEGQRPMMSRIHRRINRYIDK